MRSRPTWQINETSPAMVGAPLPVKDHTTASTKQGDRGCQAGARPAHRELRSVLSPLSPLPRRQRYGPRNTRCGLTQLPSGANLDDDGGDVVLATVGVGALDQDIAGR